MSENWTEQAACIGQGHLFFPESPADRRALVTARLICASCPVCLPCEQRGRKMLRAVIPISHGLWGGMTVAELQASSLRSSSVR